MSVKRVEAIGGSRWSLRSVAPPAADISRAGAVDWAMVTSLMRWQAIVPTAPRRSPCVQGTMAQARRTLKVALTSCHYIQIPHNEEAHGHPEFERFGAAHCVPGRRWTTEVVGNSVRLAVAGRSFGILGL
jgi:hypothetical protein